MDLIISHVKAGLSARGFDFRNETPSDLATMGLPERFHLLPRTKQLDMLYTIVRDRSTVCGRTGEKQDERRGVRRAHAQHRFFPPLQDRANFVFYSERIMRLLMEHALSLLDYEDVVVSRTASHSSSFQEI
jgi:uridine kinase